ncbi:hypothetical protein ABE237_15375, partial [Brevibacillus formosus]
PRRSEKKRNKLLASTSEKPPEWTTLDAGFAFFHGAGQSIPQGVALESERFLLFPPHHNSNVQGPYFPNESVRTIRYTLHKNRYDWWTFATHLPNQKNEVFLSICNPFIGIEQDFLVRPVQRIFCPLIGSV